ncbi:type II toxin-antitoxin system Phd/YefM family antitoxin (plasmid) [Vibrio nigripulchritudo]|uniref:type II toxin-antitoxin system Phd/YefM family antitoxin n=1 Tax=Vibrio nigripulchritudo TaxID=28173 RepID=UPI00190D108E|nr:type II toxin-antitoxin system Phd/YefM family antitoxin [Vibrio nigripulchritudo]BCL73760.1 type II toxin-antitoxin system Phd/YefM family antitoxin [Vibrio nigripulchritudo]BDU35136.1 type II toxin-antitoxin system Phd/YefM family antitoxin [Vibrio nigripulchritudo]
MNFINYTEARSRLKQVFDSVVDDCDQVTIHRRDSENVVVMSESEFNSWKETVYLLSNPNNSKRLMESLAQASNGEVVKKDI